MFGASPFASTPFAANPFAEGPFLASADESTSAADAQDRTMTTSSAVDEVTSAIDTQSVQVFQTADEAAAALDFPTVTLMYAWRFMDEPAAADDTVIVVAVQAQIDTASAAESSTRLVLFPVDETESGAAADTSDRLMSADPSAAEIATADDTIPQPGLLQDQLDSGAADDNPDRTLSAARAQAEAASADDSLTVVALQDQEDDAVADDAPVVMLMYADRFQDEAASADDTEIVIAVQTVSEVDPSDETQSAIQILNQADDSTADESAVAAAWAFVNEYFNRIDTPGLYPDVVQHKGLWFDGVNNGVVTVANDPDLQITGDMTIVLRLFPTEFGARRNPIDKAYGGELAITQEPSGVLNYYWGTAGAATNPFQSATSTTLNRNQWNVAILRRKLGAGGYVRWTINGVHGTAITPAYAAAVASTANLLIGNGYAGRYAGGIDDVRIYNRALTDQETLDVTGGGSIDNTGLVGWWSAEDQGGTAVTDKSGLNHVGTLSGTVTFGQSSYSHERASVATVFDKTGTLQTVPANVARFAYDPASVRTNKIFRSNDFSTGWTGYFIKPALTYGVAAPDGTLTATRLSSTDYVDSNPGAAGQSYQYTSGLIFTHTVLPNGQHTVSLYARCVSGTMQVTFGITDGKTNNFTLTTTWQRLVYTLPAGDTFPTSYAPNYRYLQIFETGDNNPDWEVCWAQLEEGAVATDYIPSYNGTAGSIADVVLGLLIEAASTNYVPNSTMAGAAVGVAPTGWSMGYWSVVGKGVEDGIEYIDVRINRTNSTAGLEYGGITIAFPATTLGETWTASMYVRQIAGSTTGLVWNGAEGLRLREQGGATNAHYGVNPLSVGNGPLRTSRLQVTGTVSISGTTSMMLNFQLPQAAGATVDCTFRIGLPQMEKGVTVASSPIKTSGTIATREADVAYAPAGVDVQSVDMVAPVDATDVLTADDTEAASMAATAAQTEAGAATDVPNRTMSATQAQSEAASADDTVDRTMAASASLSDSVSADETSDRDLTASVDQEDDLNATETQDRTMAAFPDQEDDAIADDAPVVMLMYADRLQSDDAVADDTQVVLAVADQDDDGVASDTTNRVVDITRDQAEVNAADDNLTVIAIQDQEDDGNAQDSPSGAGQASVASTDAVTATDTTSQQTTAGVDQDDDAAASDTQSNIAVQDQEDDGAAVDAQDKAMAADAAVAEVHAFGALSFDGVDDYAKTGTGAVSGPFAGTITVMARWRTTDTRQQRCIVANTGSAPGFRFGHSNGAVYWLVGEDGGTNYSEGTIGAAGKTNDGEWHHVALKITPATAPGNGVLQAIVDGVVYGTGSHSATYISAANGYLSFGRMGTGLAFSTADIADARIFDRDLTLAEIADIANLAANPTDALGWWPMDEPVGSGPTIYDVSGNNWHAAMPGAEGAGTSPVRISVPYPKDVPSAVGQASVSLSDATPVSETSNRVLGTNLVQAEPASADDAPTLVLMYADRFQSEVAAADDTIITIAVQAQIDSSAAFEETDRDISMDRAQADDASADEAENAVAVLDQEDDGTADDAPSASGQSQVARVEPTTSTDTVSGAASASVDAVEDAPVSESSSLDLVGTGAQSDSAEAEDWPSLNMYSQGDQEDDAAADDTAISFNVATVTSTDTGTVTDTQNRTMSTASAQADSTAASDAPAIELMYAARSQDEPASADDTEVVVMVADVSIIEYGNQIETPGLYPQYDAGLLLAHQRLSEATYFDGAGDLQVAAENEARFTPGGLLIEPGGINAIRNNTMMGASAGTPGTLPTYMTGGLGTVNGLDRRISAVGSENGIPYLDYEVSGVSTANFTAYYNLDSLTLTPATAGETWTSSIFTKKISGTIPPAFITTSGRDNLGADSDNQTAPLNVGTGPLSSQRVTATRMMSNPATVSVGQYMHFQFAQGQSYFFTIRIGGAQLEEGATATSLILTNGAVGLRQPEIAYLKAGYDFPAHTMAADALVSEAAQADHVQDIIALLDQSDANTATDTESVIAVQSQSDAGAATDVASQATAMNTNVSDTANAQDTQNRSSDLSPAVDEATAADDAPVVVLMYASRDQADDGVADDTLIALLAAEADLTEVADAEEVASGSMSADVAASDTGTVTDTTNRSLTADRAQTDSATADETESVVTVASENEPANAVEESDKLALSEVTVDDVGTVDDVQDRWLYTNNVQTDDAAADDTEAVVMVASQSQTDAASATSTESEQTSMAVDRTESTAPTDTASQQATLPATVDETNALIDTQDKTMTASQQQEEIAGADDHPSNEVFAEQSVEEQGEVTDEAQQIMVFAVDRGEKEYLVHEQDGGVTKYGDQHDSGNADDTSSQSPTLEPQGSEPTTATDEQSVQASQTAETHEDETITDTVGKDLSVVVTRTDAVTPTDNVQGSVKADADRQDTATPMDTQTSTAQMLPQQSEPTTATDEQSTSTLQSQADNANAIDTYYGAKAADANVAEQTTPSDTSSGATTIYRWLQDDAQALDLQSVAALMQRLQEDAALAVEQATVASFVSSATAQEIAAADDAVNGVVTVYADRTDAANAADILDAAVTMYQVLQEQHPALDIASALAHAQVVVSENADAQDVVTVVIPVGIVEGTDATDVTTVFLFPTNRMLIVFDDC